MLKSYTRPTDIVDTTAMERAKKMKPEQLRGDKTEEPPWDGQQLNWGVQIVCGRPTLALISALVPQALSCSVCVEES